MSDGPATEAEAALQEFVGAVVDLDVPEPMGAYLFGTYEAGSEIGRHVERTVFLEAFGNTPELLEKEYGRYEPTSVFLCVVDHRHRRAAGAVRLILPAPGGPGLKTLNDLEPVFGERAGTLLSHAGVAPPPDATWDVATLAVMPEYRGAAAAGLVSLALYQSGVRAARHVGVDWMVAILDAVVHRMQRFAFHAPFVPFAPPRPYLGSPASYPVYLHVSEWGRRIEVADPSMYDVMFHARGIEAAVRPLDLDRVGALVGAAPAAAVTNLADHARSHHVA